MRMEETATESHRRLDGTTTSTGVISVRRRLIWAIQASQHSSYRRRPPLAPAVRRRHSGRVQVARDLGEALASRVLGADALDELGWQDRRTSGRARGAPALPRRTAPFGDKALELVDGDELRTPGKLDLRDVRKEALHRRVADAECFCRLGTRVCESFDSVGFAHDDAPLLPFVAEVLLDSAAGAATA
jgi:hypothetical protein